jgi:hypothetical protein
VLIGPDARVFDGIPRLVGPRYEDVVGHLGRITGAANRMP